MSVAKNKLRDWAGAEQAHCKGLQRTTTVGKAYYHLARSFVLSSDEMYENHMLKSCSFRATLSRHMSWALYLLFLATKWQHLDFKKKTREGINGPVQNISHSRQLARGRESLRSNGSPSLLMQVTILASSMTYVLMCGPDFAACGQRPVRQGSYSAWNDPNTIKTFDQAEKSDLNLDLRKGGHWIHGIES